MRTAAAAYSPSSKLDRVSRITAGSESPAHRWINPDAESQGFMDRRIFFSLTQYVPLDTQCSDDEIKTKSSEAVVLQEGQQESDPEEDHHMDVIEQRIVGVPFLLNYNIYISKFHLPASKYSRT